MLSLLHRASSEWKAAALWMTAAGSSSPTVRHSGGMRQPSVMPPLRCIGQHGRRCYKPLSAATSRSHACHRHSAALSHGPGWNGWLLTTNAVSNPSSVSKKFEQAQVRASGPPGPEAQQSPSRCGRLHPTARCLAVGPRLLYACLPAPPYAAPKLVASSAQLCQPLDIPASPLHSQSRPPCPMRRRLG